MGKWVNGLQNALSVCVKLQTKKQNYAKNPAAIAFSLLFSSTSTLSLHRPFFSFLYLFYAKNTCFAFERSLYAQRGTAHFMYNH